jgi:hypothetical protein
MLQVRSGKESVGEVEEPGEYDSANSVGWGRVHYITVTTKDGSRVYKCGEILLYAGYRALCKKCDESGGTLHARH